MIGNKREREVGSTIVNFNVTNIYAPSNITIQSGKEEKKKIEKETQLLEDIKKILEQYPFTPKISVRLPQGTVYLPQDPSIKISCSIGLSTNGTVKLFGE